MLPTLSTQPAKRAVPIGELILDFALGWCSFYVLFVSAFALSGPFDLRGWPFFACQACALVIVYLGVGYLRGGSEGLLLLKTTCICTALLMPSLVFGNLFFVFDAIAVASTAIGIWLRRRKDDSANV